MNDQIQRDDNSTQVKRSLDEEIRLGLFRLYEQAEQYYIMEKYGVSCRAILTLYRKIRPYNFKFKEDLENLRNIITEYMESLGSQPMDGYHKIKIAEKNIEFKNLLSLFLDHIPYALSDLGLYMDLKESSLDDDGHFFLRHFNLDKTLIEEKKATLEKLPIKDIMIHMDSKMVNRVYSRHMIYTARTPTRPQL